MITFSTRVGYPEGMLGRDTGAGMYPGPTDQRLNPKGASCLLGENHDNWIGFWHRRAGIRPRGQGELVGRECQVNLSQRHCIVICSYV